MSLIFKVVFTSKANFSPLAGKMYAKYIYIYMCVCIYIVYVHIVYAT